MSGLRALNTLWASGRQRRVEVAGGRLAVTVRHLMASPAGAADRPALFTARGSLRTITLNRPKALNALNLEMVRLIDPAVRVWDADPEVAVITMVGTGEKAFCAGGDVVAVANSGRGGPGSDGGVFARDFFREEYVLDHCLARLSKPYVAFIDGITMGGGVGLSMPADFRVATERTLFAMPETGIGLFPDVGGSFFLPKLPGAFGMYLALTGFRLRGEDVTKAGIATHYIGSDKLAEVEDRLAAIDAPSKATVASVLDEYDMRSAGPPSWAPEVESIDRCFGGDSVEAIVASLEDDGSEWAAKQIKTLGKMSPTSLKLTHEQLTRGKQMSLEECFMMEYRLTQGCMRGVDFYEGIRAVLIEKDHSPVWNPSSLDAVTTDVVAGHFTPVDNDLILDPSGSGEF